MPPRAPVRLFAGMCAIALVSCSQAGDDRAVAGQTHVYRCRDGYRFVVRFEPQRAWLFLDDTVKSAPQVPTRTGLHYSNGAVTFTKTGGEARLRVGDADHTGCVNQPSEAERALK